MPSPKAKTPAPIDRPLSKAYLREFSGWSTAYPPGLSEPTSLRIMENVQINRDGSARIRPGLRYLSYDDIGLGIDAAPVGTHEAFFLNDGSKAYLFAVREADLTVGFRVLIPTVVGSTVYHLTDVAVGFTVPQGEAVLNFTAATTYVKYLQIDNKIFALSNAGETMRMFFVGDTKTAKKLSSIERPDWNVTDKLAVVEPDQPWISSGVPTGVRKNLVPNPSFENNLANWTLSNSRTKLTQSTTVGGQAGGTAARLELVPARINYHENPSWDTAMGGSVSAGDPGWSSGGGSLGWSGGMGRLANGYVEAVYHNGGGAADSVLWFLKDNAGSRFPVTPFVQANASVYMNQTAGYLGGPGHPVNVRLRMTFYNAAGTYMSYVDGPEWTTAMNDWTFRPYIQASPPAGAATCHIQAMIRTAGSDVYLPELTIKFDDFLFEHGSLLGYFDGDSGANYSWAGAANASPSYYSPAEDLQIYSAAMTVSAALDYIASTYARAGTTVRSTKVSVIWYNSGGAPISQVDSAAANDAAGAWTRFSLSQAAPAGAVTARVLITFFAVAALGEYHYADAVMLEQAAALAAYFDGDTADTTTVIRAWDGAVGGSSSTETTYTVAGTIPAAETATVNTLISSTPANNVYNFGYFYTFSNEIGESAASQVTVIQAQRRWSAWKWELPNAAGEPNGVRTSDPDQVADQLVVYMPQAVYDAAKAQGATSWNLYMLTWSNQDSVPVEGILLSSKTLTSGGAYGAEGWIRHTPQQTDTGYSGVLPQLNNRYNYSNPPKAANGLVAADRLILVDDPASPAVIRWSSNQQGEYTNFTAAKGGGYKTLTSGNLFVPASVKLWQNPQSVDTLTILCSGVDGMNTGYYMAPSAISQQSESVTVMGFEETTATPGTVSPYGCEVLNNALYHPLDTELMKSTAANYNINHKPMTEQIVNSWSALQNKHRIVSAAHDGRIYFIVHNPDGAALEAGCMGNEIWVFDAMATTGTWSRWLIQASSLRRIENSGKLYMSVIRPDGIYYLDPFYDKDDFVYPEDRAVDAAWIPWKLETNTQGANRSHDAWCHLQQISLSLGNFAGRIRWGIRTKDVHGKNLDEHIITGDDNPATADGLPYDITAQLRVGRDVMEWFLYAESVPDTRSFGQIDFVQYRYTPVSVNVGYEYGSTETFEYGRSLVQATDRNTDFGVPQPFADTARP